MIELPPLAGGGDRLRHSLLDVTEHLTGAGSAPSPLSPTRPTKLGYFSETNETTRTRRGRCSPD